MGSVKYARCQGTVKSWFVVKELGCSGWGIFVGNTGCRFGLEVFWNIRLNFFITKNVTQIDGIYSLLENFNLRYWLHASGGLSFICGG
jgi:hypothetical protein